MSLFSLGLIYSVIDPGLFINRNIRRAPMDGTSGQSSLGFPGGEGGEPSGGGGAQEAKQGGSLPPNSNVTHQHRWCNDIPCKLRHHTGNIVWDTLV